MKFCFPATNIWFFCTLISQLSFLQHFCILFKKFPKDTTLVLFALALTGTAWILTAFGTSFTYLLLVGFLYALNWPIEKISNSMVSKLVGEDEVGTAFSLLAVTAKCIEFVAKPTYGLLYRATVDVFPGTYLFVSTGFLAVIFVIELWLHLGISKREADLAKAEEEKVDNVSSG